MMRGGMTRPLGIGLVLGLMGLGSLAAHSLSYRLAEPDTGERVLLLSTTGHGYVGLAALVIASTVAAALGTLSIWALARRSAPAGRLSGLLALLPVAAFAVQEHLERLLTSGTLSLGATLEPTFLIGIVLQVPFALAALWIARALLAAVVAIVAIRPAAPPAHRREPDGHAVPVARNADVARTALLAAGLRQRGPPLGAR